MTYYIACGGLGAFIFGLLASILAPAFGVSEEGVIPFWLAMISLGVMMGLMWGVSGGF